MALIGFFFDAGGGPPILGSFFDFWGLVWGGLGWSGSGLGLLRRLFGALPTLLTASREAHGEVAWVRGGGRRPSRW